MTPDDAPIAPLAPVGADPAEPATSIARSAPGRDLTVPAAPGASGQPGLDPGAPIGADTIRADLGQAPMQPTGVATRALVHDAAMHGGRLAGAIENAAADARPTPAPGAVSDVNDRAQVLGGAAASAASGQATPRPDAPDEPDEPARSDLITPISAMDEDAHRNDPRPDEEGNPSQAR